MTTSHNRTRLPSTTFTCAVLIILTGGLHLCNGSTEEHLLLEHLQHNYKRLARPVANVTQPVVVNLGISMQQIIDVDEKNQIMTLNLWLKYTWTDWSLRWDPKEFGGIKDTRVPHGTVWMPDVLLYNSVDASFDSTYPTNMVIYSDGTVNWIPPGIFQISCEIDITWFPFDQQTCHFKFGSWTYDGSKIDLRPEAIDMSEYMINGEWDIFKARVVRYEQYYDCCVEPYPDLKFYLHMRRRTLYYGANLILPCILVTIMCLIGFLLPPDCGEKIGLQVTVLLAITVFLDYVSRMTPATSFAVPIIGVFFSTSMVIVAAALVLTVAVLGGHHFDPALAEISPKIDNFLLNWMPWLVAMHRPGTREHKPKAKDMAPKWLVKCITPEAEALLDDDARLESERDVTARIDKVYARLADRRTNLGMSTYEEGVLVMLYSIHGRVKLVTDRLRAEDEASERRTEWIFAAMAIDRACLYMFTLFIFFSTAFILFKAPFLTVTVTDPEDAVQI